MAATVSAFVDALRQVPLLDASQYKQLDRLTQEFGDLSALVQELIRREWLTSFQASQIERGQGQALVLDQYVLLDLLGQGGMGAVYSAKQTRMKRRVALKVIRRENLTAPGTVERFQREAEAAARLSHPNIVIVHDTNQVKGVHFLVMELLDGTDLAKLVEQHGSLSIKCACDYVRQAALGLQHAHEQGLVHRDIKPHNLILTRQGTVKVMDLGLARVAHARGMADSGLTGTGVPMGTPYYMAPEQALDAKGVDFRADIYALGSTLYHLLKGQPPYAGLTLVQILGALVQQNPPEPLEAVRPDVPAELLAVVRRMMAHRPEDRYQTAGEVVAAIEPFAGPVGLCEPPLVSPEETALPQQAECETVPPQGTPFPGTPFPGTPGPPARTEKAASSVTHEERPPQPGRRKLVGGLLALGLLVGTGLAGWHFREELSGWMKRYTNQPPERAATLLPDSHVAVASTPPRSDLRTQPIPVPALRLLPVADVTLTAGQNRMVPVRVQRENFKGVVEIVLEELPRGVEAKPVVIPAETDTVELEFRAATTAQAATQSVQIIASTQDVRTRERFQIIVTPAPSLRLVGLNDVILEAGQKGIVRVRVQRDHSKGPIELRLTGLPKGISATPGLVPADTELGEVELTALPDTGERQLSVKLLAIAGDARTEGSLRLIVKPTVESLLARTKELYSLRQFDQMIAECNAVSLARPDAPLPYVRRAEALILKKEHDRAIADCDRALKLQSNFPLARAVRAVAYAEKKENDRALADANEAVRLGGQIAEVYRCRGRVYHANGDYDSALKDFDEAIRLDPRDAIAFNNRAAVYTDNKKDYDRAIKDFDEAIRLDPKFVFAFTNRGIVYTNKKKYDQAIKDFDEAIRLDPKYPAAFNGRGHAYSQKKDYDRAIADYDEAIRLDPRFTLALTNRGWTYYVKKEYRSAIKDYDLAIRVDSRNAAAFYDRGLAFLYTGEYDQAIKDYNEAVRLAPPYGQAYQSYSQGFHNRGLASIQKHDYDQAIKEFDEAIRLDPDYGSAFVDRGLAYYRKQQYDRAIKDYDNAIRLAPKSVPFNNRGLAYAAKQQYDRAIQDYDEAIRLAPGYAHAFNNRGWAHYQKKDYDRAVKDYDEAIRLEPKEPRPYNQRGLAYYWKQQYDRAIKDYDEAIRLDPKFAIAFANRGLAYHWQQQYSRAIKDYDEAIRLDPTYANAFIDRANAYEKLGNKQQASMDRQQAQKLRGR